MNNRLMDLRGDQGESSANMSTFIDIPEDTDNMVSFYEKIDLIKADNDKIKLACNQLDSLTDAAIFGTIDKNTVSAKDRINELLATTNRVVQHAKSILQDIRSETSELKKNPSKASSANIRVRENLLNNFTRKFVDTAREYQDKQNRYKTRMKGKAERSVKAVKPTVTDEELEAVFQQEDGVTRVLEAAVMKQSGDPVEVANVLAEVQGTYQDVRKLEASILELHKMFLDLAILVEQQGETLDSIEAQVTQAKGFVKEANISLAGAIQSAKSARKRQCMIGGIVLAVVVVIVIIVVVMSK
mmetsp:Transcript_5314/g.8008  ORF Transcript_5314/g.8008 Transcript_5314/m.8008 type:complete len:300 (-) Transcript_5314:107-1006(-)